MKRMPSKVTKTPSRLTRALLETAKDMRDGCLLTETVYAKIIVLHLSAASRVGSIQHGKAGLG